MEYSAPVGNDFTAGDSAGADRARFPREPIDGTIVFSEINEALRLGMHDL